MDKFKVKSLKPLEYIDNGFVAWVCDDLDKNYCYYIEDGIVAFGLNRVGIAKSIDEAQILVDNHHAENVNRIINNLLEPESPIEWQTGPIPEPTETSTLTIERANGAHELCMFNRNFDYTWSKIKLPYDVIDPVTELDEHIKNRYSLTGRWHIQPIVLPTK